MSLTSTSTLAEIQAAYDDNSAYDVNGSVSQAKLFVQACRMLMRRMPKMASQDRGSVQLSPELIQQEMQVASAFLASTPDTTSSNITGGGVRHFDLGNLRGECG
jgi:hypothetical protein